jgi:hypothetical protein
MTAPFLQGLKEAGLCRGPEPGGRVSVCGEPIRSAAGARNRSRPPPRSRDPSRRHRRIAGGEGSDHDHTHRLYFRG